MRDPARIPRIMSKLQTLWAANPDLRFCQLVYHIDTPPNFYTEDDAIELELERLLARTPGLDGEAMEPEGTKPEPHGHHYQLALRVGRSEERLNVLEARWDRLDRKGMAEHFQKQLNSMKVDIEKLRIRLWRKESHSATTQPGDEDVAGPRGDRPGAPAPHDPVDDTPSFSKERRERAEKRGAQ